MIIVTEILLLIFGFALLSLSMSRHYNDVMVRRQRLTKNTILLFRVIGYSSLIIAAIVAVNVWGLALGLVYWFGTATLVTTLLSLTLTYHAHCLLLILLMFKLDNKPVS